jgi:hypothetical protein
MDPQLDPRWRTRLTTRHERQPARVHIQHYGNSISQTHATVSYDALTLCQRGLTRHGRIGSHNLYTDYACGRLAAEGVHILHKTI